VPGLDRRTILGLLGGASTTTIVAVATTTPAVAYDPGTAETKARYRETDHVKAFYRTNGYETLQKRE
jgi:hypothetical protein